MASVELPRLEQVAADTELLRKYFNGSVSRDQTVVLMFVGDLTGSSLCCLGYRINGPLRRNERIWQCYVTTLSLLFLVYEMGKIILCTSYSCYEN